MATRTFRVTWVQGGKTHFRDYDNEATAVSAAFILQMNMPRTCKNIEVHPVEEDREPEGTLLGPLPVEELL
jgi:hypothetical protein